MAAVIHEAPEQVLSTMTREGARVWLHPRLSKGRFLNARRIVAYALMILFLALPFGHTLVNALGGHSRQWVLLNIVKRQFTILGYTFLPTDTVLLALFMLIVFVSIFLFTALLGRLWCGWACPQTVYMEFLYRPLERLIEGTIGKGGPANKGIGDWRKPVGFVAALVVSLIPAHTFLAYFVPVEELTHWITGNPLHHSTAFVVVALTTGLMMFDFYYFREQLCLIACPYGRFQSVLLDKWSMIVSYDKRRGEPRSKLRRGGATTIALPIATAQGAAVPTESHQGDCVDCSLCVTTCPTGIDIRAGLQMECINCTQCIDACDAVMDKVSRPRGLIRYSSQSIIDGEKPRMLRPRVIFYPLLLVVLVSLWLWVFSHKGAADVTLLRNFGSPFVTLSTGEIGNSLRLKLVNRTEVPANYTCDILDLAEARLAGETTLSVAPGESKTATFVIAVPRKVFRAGIRDVTLRVHQTNAGDGQPFVRDVTARLLGPQGPLPQESNP